MSPSDEGTNSPDPAAVAPPIDPRLRGQQASPAPQPEALPLTKIGLGAAVALALAIMLCGRGSDEPSEEGMAVAATGDVAGVPEQAQQQAPLAGTERPEIIHAEAWELSAEALGEIEKHLNRAKLIFEDIDEQEAKIAAARVVAPPPSVPTGDPAAQGAPADPSQAGEFGAAAPEPAVPTGPSPEQVAARAEAVAIWSSWKSNWMRDMEVAAKMLPPAGQVDAGLLPGYQAVAQLVGACRGLPSGDLPGRGTRDAWLRKLQNQSVAVRRQLELAR